MATDATDATKSIPWPFPVDLFFSSPLGKVHCITVHWNAHLSWRLLTPKIGVYVLFLYPHGECKAKESGEIRKGGKYIIINWNKLLENFKKPSCWKALQPQMVMLKECSRKRKDKRRSESRHDLKRDKKKTGKGKNNSCKYLKKWKEHKYKNFF